MWKVDIQRKFVPDSSVSRIVGGEIVRKRYRNVSCRYYLIVNLKNLQLHTTGGSSPSGGDSTGGTNPPGGEGTDAE